MYFYFEVHTTETIAAGKAELLTFSSLLQVSYIDQSLVHLHILALGLYPGDKRDFGQVMELPKGPLAHSCF